jgi:hypothetical protein
MRHSYRRKKKKKERKSFRKLYPAVKEAPSEIIDLCKTLKDGNTKRLLSFLIENPQQFTVGFYDSKDATVYCDAELFSYRHVYLTKEVGIGTLHSAVGSLNQVLGNRNFPYRVWFSCPEHAFIEPPSKLLSLLEALNKHIEEHDLPYRKMRLVPIRDKTRLPRSPFVIGLVKIA